MNESIKNKKEETKKDDVKSIFKRIVSLMRKDLVAIFQKESDNAVLIRSVGGKTFRIRVEEVI